MVNNIIQFLMGISISVNLLSESPPKFMDRKSKFVIGTFVVIEEYKAEQIKIQEEQARIEEEQKMARQLQEIENQRLANSKEVTCYITYYTNIDDALQGGQYDKKGNLLVSHGEPICALPSDVPYGSYLELEEPILGATRFKNVDTGGAIVWLDNNTCKVDIFIPNVSYDWIINNTENKVVRGRIFY